MWVAGSAWVLRCGDAPALPLNFPSVSVFGCGALNAKAFGHAATCLFLDAVKATVFSNECGAVHRRSTESALPTRSWLKPGICFRKWQQPMTMHHLFFLSGIDDGTGLD